MKTKFILIIAVVVFAIALLITIKNPPTAEKSMVAMDTIVSITAEGWGADKKIQSALDRIREVEQRMSKTIETSDVARINKGDTYWGNRETQRVINRGIFYGNLSGGMFDISIGPIVNLYERYQNPSDIEIDKATSHINYKDLVINKPLPSDMSIDLGSIAKGYAGDEAVLDLRKNGINNIMVNMGGDIVTAGSKKWKVGIKNPFDANAGSYMGTLEIINKAVATSGTYERGEHIFNPKTGKPADNNIVSATVITSLGGMDADALATIAFLMGKDAFGIIRSQGADCILITKNHEVFTSFDQNKKYFKITDKQFKYKEN